jgi:ABC-type branched-subunit amino acid transport system substrate-binding protein
MTLVLNHLLQLSGNKYVILGLVCLVLSCSSKQYALEQTNLKSNFEKQQIRSKSEPEKQIPVKANPTDTTDQIYPLTKKNSYNIVFILPMMLDIADFSEPQLKGTAKSALDFYMGSVIALQQCTEKTKSNFKVYVFDSRNTNESITKDIIPQLNKIQPDLIVGPFLFSQMKILYNYCNENKVTLINPLISPDSFSNLNPYFINLRPTDKTYMNYIGELLKRNFTEYNITIIAENNQDKDRYTRQVVSMIDTNKAGHIQSFKADESNWRNPLFIKSMREGKNVFLIFNKSSEVVINSLLTNLIGIQNKEETAIVAPYSWLHQNTIDLGFLQNLNSHFITDYYFNYNDSNNFDFINRFRSKYNNEPNVMASIGYKFTDYFCRQVYEKGKYFEHDLMYSQPAIDSTVSIKLFRFPGQTSFQNYHMTILHYQGSDLKQLNLK